jgi:hypothetical protein
MIDIHQNNYDFRGQFQAFELMKRIYNYLSKLLKGDFMAHRKSKTHWTELRCIATFKLYKAYYGASKNKKISQNHLLM